MEKFVFVFLALLLCSGNHFAQQISSDERELARIGNISISVEEYRNRFELMYPYKPVDGKEIDSVKTDFLYSLIAEKLWALESIAAGADTLPDVQKLIKQLKKIYLLDAFYRDSIEAGVHITHTQIQQGIQRLPRTLFIQMLKSVDKSVLQTAFNELQNGASFDTLMRKMHGFTTAFPVVFGQLSDAAVEDAVYSLKPGSHTGILKADDQYIIIKLIRIDENNLAEKDIQSLQKEAEFQLRRRAGVRLQKQLIERYFGNVQVTVDGESYRMFAKHVFTTLKQRSILDSSSAQISLKLSEFEVQQIKLSLGKELLNKPFILFPTLPVTLDEFIDYIPFIEVKLKQLKAASFDAVLRNEIQKYIEREHLARIAEKLGYGTNASVLNRLKLWRESILAEKGRELFTKNLLKTSSVDSNNIQQNKQECKKAIAFSAVYANSINTMDSVLSFLQWGMEFAELSHHLSTITTTKLEVKPLDSLVNPAARIVNLAPGAIIGPFSKGEQYVLYKIVDTLLQCRESSSSLKGINLQFLSKAMDAKIAELSYKFSLKTHEALLPSIPVSAVNMITIEQLGFGLKLPAFPFIPKESGWKKQIQSIQIP